MQYYNNPNTYNQVCTYAMANTNMNVRGAGSVIWQRIATSNPSLTWSQNGNDINFYLWSAGQTEVFRINASNICGSVSSDFGFKDINCNGGGGGGNPCNLYQVSPNPGSHTLQVTVIPNIPAPCDPPPVKSSIVGNRDNHLYSELPQQPKTYIQYINLYNSRGQLILRKNYSSGTQQIDLDISSMAAGIYFLKIINGDYDETHRVIVGN